MFSAAAIERGGTKQIGAEVLHFRHPAAHPRANPATRHGKRRIRAHRFASLRTNTREVRSMPIFDAKDLTASDGYTLLSGIVVPRPIAWVTSMDPEGRVNAAPFSCYTYVSNRPPMLAINMGRRDGKLKDTVNNLRRRGTYVVNVVTEALLEEMHQSSFDYPPDVSEAEVLGLQLAPSRLIDVPRLADVPIALECRLREIHEFGEQHNELVIGEVLSFVIADELFSDGKVDFRKFRPPARIGGPNYSRLVDIVSLKEVSNNEVATLAPPTV
jgi:flavin reductase (DIM6/NTAB) family NADH-FMN oxidoreductase RutF